MKTNQLTSNSYRTLKRNVALVPAIMMTALGAPIHEAFGQEESLDDGVKVSRSVEAHDRPLTPEEIAQIRAENAAIFAQLAPDNLGAEQAVVVGPIASFVGKTVFSALLSSGMNQGFAAVFGRSDLSNQELSDQISSLSASVHKMNQDITELTNKIEDLNDTVNWGFFTAEHNKANRDINAIYTAYGKVKQWIVDGLALTEKDWKEHRTKVVAAVSNLAGAPLNPAGGHLDSKDGIISKLFTSIPQDTTTIAEYWTLVESYRDYYRTALAIAYLTLDLMEDNFDGTGVTRVDADDALTVGRRAVWTIYSYGVPPTLAEEANGKIHDLVHLRGSQRGFANPNFRMYVPSTSKRSRAFLETERARAEQLGYDGHKTFQQYLQANGMPTRYLHWDRWYLQYIGNQWDQLSVGRIEVNNNSLTPPVSTTLLAYKGDLPAGQSLEAYKKEVQLQAYDEGVITNRPGQAVSADLHYRSHPVLVDQSVRSELAQMAARYDPDHHDGMTLEQLFKSLGLPTAYMLHNIALHEYTLPDTSWDARLVPPSEYMLMPAIGRIVGNEWVEQYEDYKKIPTKGGKLREESIRFRAEIIAAGGFGDVSATIPVVDLFDLDHANGRPTLTDPEAVAGAAFGDPASIPDLSPTGSQVAETATTEDSVEDLSLVQ